MASVTARFRGAVNGAGNILGSEALPLIPDSLKRVVVGRRSIMIDENRLDPTLQIMLAALNALALRDLTDGGDPTIVCESNARMLAQFDHKPIPVSAVDDLTISGPHGEIPARHYQPGPNVRAPLMVFYHGGGFMFGNHETHDRLCRLICRGVGIHLLSVAYRLAPEHPAPAPVQDAYADFLWALAHAGGLGAEPGTVCVGGDSARGNLAAAVSHQARDEGTPPQLQLLLYPATDMRGVTSSRKVFAEGFLLTRKDIGLMERDYLTNSGMEVTEDLAATQSELHRPTANYRGDRRL
jgi:acetyl esterase